MSGLVTINTDAGFLPIQKVGSYAYWIKGNGLKLTGSGIFKDECKNSLDAEKKAIVNALAVLYNSNFKAEKIIINRDCIYAKQSGCELSKKMKNYLRKIKIRSIGLSHKNYAGSGYVEYRHVKGHSKNMDARSWVNRWCDSECSRLLKPFKVTN